MLLVGIRIPGSAVLHKANQLKSGLKGPHSDLKASETFENFRAANEALLDFSSETLLEI